jgi:hypothetical protein
MMPLFYAFEPLKDAVRADSVPFRKYIKCALGVAIYVRQRIFGWQWGPTFVAVPPCLGVSFFKAGCIHLFVSWLFYYILLVGALWRLRIFRRGSD